MRGLLCSAVLLVLLVCSIDCVEEFQVIFSGEAVAGQLMTRKQTAAQPSIAAPSLSATGSDKYTVLMFDPDAPSPESPTCKSWLHWMLVDASGSHLTGGTDVEGYAPPTPPIGVHTYHVALYKQSSGLAGSVSAPSSRCKFSPSGFAADHGLEMVSEK
eukprot:CAMPEP_0173393492 /NCGR_PEP_ID=MMETSP1356-20130122/22139_1 /TAXON_ID=77927 ORGANISM="Hemiselmis virescens, Strain PCC157" /NCGR_SAMPLE_ID=MMETSP1356 /ASSEMBLY_ACC=CAM_ASM_000847 /LENGTH=157 /DNA_ID=CAMNT_0014351513 /DNA_START=133 /DNA_END=603 /DNA_ORIENTATION=+